MAKTIFGTVIGMALGLAVAFGFPVSKAIARQIDLSRTGVRQFQRSNQ